MAMWDNRWRQSYRRNAAVFYFAVVQNSRDLPLASLLPPQRLPFLLFMNLMCILISVKKKDAILGLIEIKLS